jgi:hypothetical protein
MADPVMDAATAGNDGWQLVKPQWARHSDGYEVYSDGTFRVAYEDARGKAVVAAERLSSGVVLDPNDIVWERPDGSTHRMRRGDRAQVLTRCVAGLQFLGSEVEVASS